MPNPASASEAPVIHMQGVAFGSLQDPSSTLLSEVDWQVQAGDFWVVAGLQGSGKSDFLMLTAGLMAPSSGEYQLFGEPMPIFDESRLAERLRLGLVFQNGQLFNHLTVRENVGLPLRYHHNLSKAEAAGLVDAMLERMDLAAWADSTPGALAGNWHKRVGLARALMLQPEVLLLDNPLAGLDLRHLYWWLDLLERLAQGHNAIREQPLTLVVTTADLRPWMSLGRQFAVIQQGRLTVIGDRTQLAKADPGLVGELLTREQPKDG